MQITGSFNFFDKVVPVDKNFDRCIEFAKGIILAGSLKLYICLKLWRTKLDF